MTRMTLDEARELTERLKLFAQPQRLLILSLLLDGPRAVSELENETGITQPTLSQQLGALRRANLVAARRESRAIFYSMADGKATDTTRALFAVLGLKAAGARSVPVRSPAHVFDGRSLTETGAQFARVMRIPRNNGI
ncbi:ArsR/SmtB family transcription factor [Brytella acorum]|uniref:Metalloregulator ArsR/SmtB family transcription factor n=1 Tax=Brytella acorum TaxID=2959299 RepID=A0AA35UKY2_9PROT|nr:metalloregulator ArsR/SmtB family transcription factor [Brytella acorum]MDF3625256.1 metalloregulator ArsR/SmtB family transcription factor [Brytella acorum]CAI9119332.1 metalloregulator ArsR/SmtB family transcription factor [Brytella acorum]